MIERVPQPREPAPPDAPEMLMPSLRVPASRPPRRPPQAPVPTIVGGLLLAAAILGGGYFVVDAIRESRKTPFERAMEKTEVGKEWKKLRAEMERMQKENEKALRGR